MAEPACTCAQELLLILDEHWNKHPELQQIPVYCASQLAKKCMAVYQTYINMMNERIRKQCVLAPHPTHLLNARSPARTPYLLRKLSKGLHGGFRPLFLDGCVCGEGFLFLCNAVYCEGRQVAALLFTGMPTTTPSSLSGLRAWTAWKALKILGPPLFLLSLVCQCVGE